MIKGKHIAITGILAENYISQGQNIKIIKEDEFLRMLWLSPLEVISGNCLRAVV